MRGNSSVLRVGPCGPPFEARENRALSTPNADISVSRRSHLRMHSYNVKMFNENGAERSVRAQRLSGAQVRAAQRITPLVSSRPRALSSNDPDRPTDPDAIALT